MVYINQNNHNANTYIVFNDKGKENALKLHQYMKSRGGYVSDKTPKEGYYVGKLLGYTDESIWKYIKFNIDRRRYTINNIDDIPKNLQKYFDNSEINSTFVDKQYNDSYLNHMTEEVDVSTENLPFKNDVESLGGKIYSVGGAVRDEFLNKISKDLDLLITNIPMDKLESILSKYGTVNSVGKSFGVLKFKPNGATEDIDIAIPRTDKKTDDGHKGFEITSDHTLPIENDLYRRDFTINAIAKDINNKIVDPYNGREDLKNKIIRVVNPKAFGEDPLRMLRAVQFSSRFNFNIEPNTMKLIQENASKISEIAPERILIEFEKIVGKGNPRLGVQLLKDTFLFKNIFGFDIKQSKIDSRPFDYVKTMGEFIFLLLQSVENPSNLYLQIFSTEDSKKDKIYKEIKALTQAFDITTKTDNPIALRSIIHNMYLIYPESINSGILPEGYAPIVSEFKNGKYPLTFSQLDVNGEDLINIGLKGKVIGDTLKNVLLKIYSNKLQNDKESILNFIQSSNVNESIADRYAEKQFGIPNDFAKHDIIQKTEDNIEKPVAKFTTRNGFVIPIYKNPKSLDGFENNVRAISDIDGNIYVTPYDKDFIHDQIGIALGLLWNDVYYYLNTGVENFKYLILLRVGNSNKFGISTSNSDVIYKGSDLEKKRLQYLLKKVKSKNPQFEFSYKLQYKSFNNEGVADKYAEKEFGISNTVDNFNKVYDDKTNGQPIAFISENGKKRSSGIFKNPKTMNNFDDNVRAFCDINGNLYVLNKNINVFHSNIINLLLEKGFVDDKFEYYDAVRLKRINKSDMMNYIGNLKYVTLIRKDDENQFILSESMYDIYNKEELARLELILRNTKQKNPQFKYQIDFNDTIIENVNKNDKISYSAVVLDKESRSKLIESLSGLIPNGYDIIAHHMTINLGEIKGEYKKDLGSKVTLVADKYSIDDKVMAVMVSGYYTKNKIPHITIGVNRSNGGKPVMSNNLVNWIDLEKPIELTGYVKELKENKKIINESTDKDKRVNEKGCLMVYCNIDNWDKIIGMIKPEDVYDEPGYGVETKPHVTILYGFDLSKVNSDDVFKLFKDNFSLDKIKLSTKKISLFENKEFDVVKFDIDSDDLAKMNKVVSKLPNENDFPIYHPHMTIAYVKSGCGKKYIKELKKKYSFSSDKLVYSGEEVKKTLKLEK